MRLIWKCILLLPMYGLCCAAFPLASQRPTISIESKDLTVQSGRPIVIHIILKNTTDHDFTVLRSVGGSHGELYYSISVTSPDGNPAILTEYGAAIQKNQGFPGSRIIKTLAPGEDVEEYVDISKMFDVTSAGTYVIHASRGDPLNPRIILKSNALVIKVAVLPSALQQPTISIDSKDLTVQSGQPIVIRITLKNTTNRDFTILRSFGGGRGEQYYSISVTGPDGNPAVPT